MTETHFHGGRTVDLFILYNTYNTGCFREITFCDF